MEEAVADYQRGDSLATISTRIGLPQATIHYALLQAGVAMHPRPGWRSDVSPAEGERAVRLYTGGSSVAAVSRKLGWSQAKVRGVLGRAGATIR